MNLALKFFYTSSHSFIRTRKQYRPNTEPCGTPNEMFDIEELKFLTDVETDALQNCYN